MYFLLAFDNLSDEQEERIEVLRFFKESLQEFAWVKPLSTLYVVDCDDEELRKKLINTLSKYASEHAGKIRYIITPLIDSGHVSGYIPKKLVESLLIITKDDFSDLDKVFDEE
jgi:hypothetical protein